MNRLAGALLALVLPVLGQAADSAAGASDDAAPFGAPASDQRVYVHGLLDQFEYRAGGEDPVSRWDGEAWLGTDTNRLWIRSEGEVNRHGQVTDGQQELLYDRPVTTFFDLQTGLRYDLDSRSGRAWAAFGVEGLAPYFLQVSATAYASDGGRFAAKIKASHEALLTQRWILQPELEVNLYSHDDPIRRIGAGVADIDAGLRLRYEIRRELAPYLGLGYQRSFGRTAQFARADGESSESWRILLGVRAWF